MVKMKFLIERKTLGKVSMSARKIGLVVGVILGLFAHDVTSWRRATQAEQRATNTEESNRLLKDELEDEKGWTKIFQGNLRESNRYTDELEEDLKLHEKTTIALARENGRLKREVAGYVKANWPAFMAIALGWKGEPQEPPLGFSETGEAIGWIADGKYALPKGWGFKQIHDYMRPCEDGRTDCSSIGEWRLKDRPLPVVVSVPKTADHCTICHKPSR